MTVDWGTVLCIWLLRVIYQLTIIQIFWISVLLSLEVGYPSCMLHCSWVVSRFKGTQMHKTFPSQKVRRYIIKCLPGDLRTFVGIIKQNSHRSIVTRWFKSMCVSGSWPNFLQILWQDSVLTLYLHIHACYTLVKNRWGKTFISSNSSIAYLVLASICCFNHALKWEMFSIAHQPLSNYLVVLYVEAEHT